MPEKREKIDFTRDEHGIIGIDACNVMVKYAQKRGLSYRQSLRILQKLFQGGRTSVRNANNPATAEEVTSKHLH